MAIPNYVKFQRGSASSYQNLVKKDDNTLYFVYNNDDQTKGSLYLGTRLISDSVGGNSTISLADLTDVLINSVNTGDFLVVNSEGKWTPISAAEVAQLIIEENGNFVSIDENEFTFNAVNGKLELKNYNDATIGMVPVKSNDGLNWRNFPPNLSTEVGTLQTAVTDLQLNFQTIDNKIATAIANTNHLTYSIIDDIADATELGVIYLINNDSSDIVNAYDEYMLINGQLEKIGTYGINLNNYVTNVDFNNALNRISNLETVTGDFSNTYVTKIDFNAKVGNLSSLNQYNNLDYTNASIADTFSDIYTRLIWQEIS